MKPGLAVIYARYLPMQSSPFSVTTGREKTIEKHLELRHVNNVCKRTGTSSIYVQDENILHKSSC